MKKTLVTLAVAAAFSLSSFAQRPLARTVNRSKFSIGFDMGLPTSDDLLSIIIGGSLTYEVHTAKNTFLTLSAGYQSFRLKSQYIGFGGANSKNYVPIKVGIKYYTVSGFFLEAQAGASISTQPNSFPALAYAPGIGYNLKGRFELGARFEGWELSGIGQATMRIAFKF